MLKTRLLASLPFVAVAIGAVFWPGIPGAILFLALAAYLTVTAVRELFSLTAKCGFSGYPKLTTFFAILLLLSTALSGSRLILAMSLRILVIAAYILTIFFYVFISPLEHRREEFCKLLVSFGGFFYLIWTLNFIAQTYFSAGLDSAGRHLVFFLIVVTKMADVGAFAVGTLTAKRPRGNHKLAPSLSPKKSWEGLGGGLAAAIFSAVILLSIPAFSFSFSGVKVLNFTFAIYLGIILTVIGLLGDLAESAIKRAAQAKDSGNIPGLGGALDMLDSLIPAAPVFYAFLFLLYLTVQ